MYYFSLELYVFVISIILILLYLFYFTGKSLPFGEQGWVISSTVKFMSTRGFNYHRGGLVSLVGNQVCDTLLWSKFSNTSFSGPYYRKKSAPKLDISTDFCCIDFYFFLTVSQYLSSWINVVKTLPNLSFDLISERMKLH